MKFAVNYSPQAAELVKESVIEFDLFKCADWPEIIEPAKKVKPIYIHFPLTAGKKERQMPDVQAIRSLLEISESSYVNIHLEARVADYPHIKIDSGNPAHQQQVGIKMMQDVHNLGKEFGVENIIVENLPYQLDKSSIDILQVAVLPQTISNIVTQGKVGFLLDIDHARVAASTLGMDFKDYISCLPVDRIKELHMTGTWQNDGWLQSHLEMKEDDWEIFRWCCEKIRSEEWSTPDIFAFEYGGIGELFEWRSKKEVLAEQVPQFVSILKEFGLRN